MLRNLISQSRLALGRSLAPHVRSVGVTLSRTQGLQPVANGPSTESLLLVKSCFPLLQTSSYATATEASAKSEAKEASAQSAKSEGGKSTRRAFEEKPQSLAVKPFGKFLDEEKMGKVGKALLWVGGYYSKESTELRGANQLYEVITTQSTDADLFIALKLKQDFQSEFALMTLHMWMVLHRLRAMGPGAKNYQQALYDSFMEDLEMRVYNKGVRVRVSKWLKEFEEVFYGSTAAYDKAVQELGDGSSKSVKLRVALHRNVYAFEGKETAGPEILVRYVRRELQSLFLTPNENIIKGHIRFGQDFPRYRLS
mmetsp:Transcript_14002/g.16954  ORF Transcript_14002/g.16954 Transcript_14002/m.16954 type:complete len:311 (-) Transcript_14002:420-1352(-)|eukprot:CAMPEP_0197848968 /NCGR_PEP_ID=MMETSP1438-20131217/10566_1 /TAXON_ID=1461541 /ORGANISM="Pterosperma sp., Strain CCMP1384" /LENGTH=310 /DNA_ID=CAMNT_0043461453 /DNA_START=226 /DNA_END=1158 /DNA_ORIENTATION=+